MRKIRVIFWIKTDNASNSAIHAELQLSQINRLGNLANKASTNYTAKYRGISVSHIFSLCVTVETAGTWGQLIQ